MKLNIGSGEKKKEGFINVDIQPLPEVELVAPAWNLPSIENGQVDEIHSRHAIEHLTLKEARKAFREWARVLRPDGVLNIICPNRSFHISILEKDPTLGMAGLYGWQRDEYDIHKWAWTAAELIQELAAAGFTSVVEVETQERDVHVMARR